MGPFQLIFSPDGVNGLCYDHTVAEGVAVISVILKVLASTYEETSVNGANGSLDIECPGKTQKDPDLQHHFKRVDWNLTDDLRNRILESADRFNRFS